MSLGISPVPPISDIARLLLISIKLRTRPSGYSCGVGGLLGFSPYARSFAWLLFLYDYRGHRRRGVAGRLRQHLTITERESASPSAFNRSDSYGGDTTSLTTRRERSGERSIAS